jgi:hypothetical protein
MRRACPPVTMYPAHAYVSASCGGHAILCAYVFFHSSIFPSNQKTPHPLKNYRDHCREVVEIHVADIFRALYNGNLLAKVGKRCEYVASCLYGRADVSPEGSSRGHDNFDKRPPNPASPPGSRQVFLAPKYEQ